MVGRDIALAELTGGHVHLMNISTRNSVEELKRAKGMGIRVTADVTPHHLAMTDASLVKLRYESESSSSTAPARKMSMR